MKKLYAMVTIACLYPPVLSASKASTLTSPPGGPALTHEEQPSQDARLQQQVLVPLEHKRGQPAVAVESPLQQERDALKSETSRLTSRVQLLETELRAAKAQLAQTQTASRDQRAQLEQRINDLTAQVNGFKNQAQEAKDSKVAHDLATAEYYKVEQAKQSALQAKATLLENEIATLKRQVSQLKGDNTQLTTANRNLTDANRKLTRASDDTIASLKADNATLRNRPQIIQYHQDTQVELELRREKDALTKDLVTESTGHTQTRAHLQRAVAHNNSQYEEYKRTAKECARLQDELLQFKQTSQGQLADELQLERGKGASLQNKMNLQDVQIEQQKIQIKALQEKLKNHWHKGWAIGPWVAVLVGMGVGIYKISQMRLYNK